MSELIVTWCKNRMSKGIATNIDRVVVAQADYIAQLEAAQPTVEMGRRASDSYRYQLSVEPFKVDWVKVLEYALQHPTEGGEQS